ncbi:MAG: DUF4012 domain-containing protein [Actinomycetota bacterium]
MLGAGILRFARPLLAGAPAALLPGLAAVGAVVAVVADASPTGFKGTDLAAKAALGAGMVLAAARISPATCAAAGAFGVLCSGGSSEAAVAAGGALGLVAAVLAAGEGKGVPALQALAGGALAQAALRLEWPEPTGASAAAAALIVAPVLLSGLGRAPAPVRRTAGRAAAGFVVFALVSSVAAVLAALGARTSVDQGVKAAREGLAAVERSDRDGAADGFGRAAAAFDEAEGSIGAWWARPAFAVPVVGQHAKALEILASSGAELAEVGARAAREADPSTLRLTNGGFDLDALAAVRRPVESALASLERSADELGDADSPWLVAPVADRLDELAIRVRSARSTTRTAVLALRHAPALLGADEPRRYFVAVQNPAETRGNGGLLANFGELVAENGRLTLGRFGRHEELMLGGAGASRTLSGPPDYVRRYAAASPARFWNVNLSPDFPTMAQVIEELYPQSGGAEIDGVISVDPYAFAAFLRLVGPIQVPGRADPLTAENAPAALLHEQYVQFGQEGEAERRDFLGTATRTLFGRLTSTTLPAPRAIADALSPAVAGRHLQLSSTRPAEQRFFEHIGAAGAIPPVRGDFLGVVTQNYNGNKIDWFLRRAYRYEADVDPSSGRVSARLEISLRNDAPAEGLPKAVIGYGGHLVPEQPVTADGENLLYLSVYSPLLLEGMAIDGKAVEAAQENELGRRVYSTLVSVPSRSTRTVEVRLTGRVRTDGGYRLDVLRQPIVAPDEASVSVALVDGWRVASADGLEGIGTGTATATGVALDRNRTFRAVPERSGDGWLDRLRRGR